MIFNKTIYTKDYLILLNKNDHFMKIIINDIHEDKSYSTILDLNTSIDSMNEWDLYIDLFSNIDKYCNINKIRTKLNNVCYYKNKYLEEKSNISTKNINIKKNIEDAINMYYNTNICYLEVTFNLPLDSNLMLLLSFDKILLHYDNLYVNMNMNMNMNNEDNKIKDDGLQELFHDMIIEIGRDINNMPITYSKTTKQIDLLQYTCLDNSLNYSKFYPQIFKYFDSLEELKINSFDLLISNILNFNDTSIVIYTRLDNLKKVTINKFTTFIHYKLETNTMYNFLGFICGFFDTYCKTEFYDYKLMIKNKIPKQNKIINYTFYQFDEFIKIYSYPSDLTCKHRTVPKMNIYFKYSNKPIKLSILCDSNIFDVNNNVIYNKYINEINNMQNYISVNNKITFDFKTSEYK